MDTSVTSNSTGLPDSLVENGEIVYETQLRKALEPQHSGEFIAIEPSSARYFLGRTATAALVAARNAMPGSEIFLTRVGRKSAHKIGGHGSRIS